MIKALAPLGANNHVSITLAYEGDDVTATVIVKPKKGDGAVLPIQFCGPVAEVEAALTKELTGVANKIVTSQNNLAELDAQLKKDEEEAAKTKGAKKAAPAKAETPAPAGKKGKPGKKTPAATPTKSATAETPGAATSATALLELDDL